jgi:hypothetical protein
MGSVMRGFERRGKRAQTFRRARGDSRNGDLVSRWITGTTAPGHWFLQTA